MKIFAQRSVVVIGVIGIIGILIMKVSCTNSTLSRYQIQMTNTEAITSDPRESIATVKSLLGESQEIFETYCTSTHCKAITCTSISSSDPVVVASKYIRSTFKVHCYNKSKIENLTFRDCKFPDGILKNSWLISDIAIHYIRFEDCELSEIEMGAFPSMIFSDTVSLAFIRTHLEYLKGHVFEQMSKLRGLTIHDNIINGAEYDLLREVAQTLETVELDRCIVNPQVLHNITTGTPLSKVQILSLRGNNIPNLSQEIFNGFLNISSLYMDTSKIQNIDVNTFSSMRFVQQIFMNNNLLKTLPNGLFDPILLYNKNLMLNVVDNPWQCNCNLKWMHELISNYPKLFTAIPACQSPEINKGKKFSEVEFCNESASEHDASTEIVEITPEIENNTENNTDEFFRVLCGNSRSSQFENLSRKFFDLSDDKFSLKSLQDFSLCEYNNGSVAVNISDYKKKVRLLWFSIDENKIGKVNCLNDVRTSTLLSNLNEDTTYIVCAFNEIQLIPLPFNCLGLKTKPPKNIRMWLSNEDKALVLSSYTLVLFLFGSFSAGICFFAIWRNPSMLRGSSRVVMVRHGHVKALILPKNVSYSNVRRKRMNKRIISPIEATNACYLTPVETNLDNLSSIYESIQNKITSSNDFAYNEPPPLPPRPYYGVHQFPHQQNYCYHHQQLPSLSLEIDSLHNQVIYDDEPYQNDEDAGIYSRNLYQK